MDAQRASHLLERIKTLDIDAGNLIGAGSAGPPGAAEAFRLRYLRWRDDVERLLNDADVGVEEVSALQSARHRDLVNARVPDRQLYAEVRAEVELLQRVLGQLMVNLDAQRASPGRTSSMPAEGTIEFISDAGATYTYDPASPAGIPGASGAVFRGTGAHGNPVAIKRVPLRTSSTRHRIEDRLLAEREVIITGQLGKAPSSHLVPVLDTAHRDDELLLVMPLATRSLADLIDAEGPLDSATAMEVVRQIAAGLQELAAASIVHRDIKPNNILEIDSRWCLADFGISRILTDRTATLTWMGSGTVEYRAPELWNGQPETVASDFYAMGCVAYEMLTGHKAFPGPDHRDQHQTRVPALPSDVDPSFTTLIMELLDKRAAGRPQDARRVVEALSPAGPLTSGQRGLQLLKAASALRHQERTALDGLAMQLHERQEAGKAAWNTFWRQVIDKARQAVPDAAPGEDADGGPTLKVGDAQLRVRISKPAFYHPELLFVGEVAVQHVAGQDDRENLLPGNLLCVWRDPMPQWMIIRFDSQGTSKLPGIAAEVTQLARLWPAIMNNPTSEILHSYDPATPDGLIALFVSALDIDTRSEASPSSPDLPA